MKDLDKNLKKIQSIAKYRVLEKIFHNTLKNEKTLWNHIIIE